MVLNKMMIQTKDSVKHNGNVHIEHSHGMLLFILLTIRFTFVLKNLIAKIIQMRYKI